MPYGGATAFSTDTQYSAGMTVGTLGLDVGIILVCAAALGLVANRTGQPSIVAYIVAGLLVGPVGLGLVGVGELTATMAELGLAFLLFLLGIKMRLEDVRHIFRPVVAIAVPQMALVAGAGAGLAYLLGFAPVEAGLIGLAVMYSSTAVAIKMLTNKDEATSLHGKLDIGVLLVQDIVVVVLLTFLATGEVGGPADVAFRLGTIIAVIAALAAAALAMSRYILPPLFRRIADTPEVFFLIAVSWAFLFVLIAQELELSIEMGAFLAGVSIAQLPYSRELQGRINPLTDVFVLVFFATIGLQLAPEDLFAYWPEALVAGFGLMAVKFVVFLGLLRWQGFGTDTAFRGSVPMVQVSEFGLIVGAAGVGAGYIDEAVLGFLSLAALVSMAGSVYLIQFDEALREWGDPLLRRLGGSDDDSADPGPRRGHAIIVGYDEIAHEAIQALERYYDVVFVDRNPETVELLDEEGHEVIYGDFRHEAIRKDVGLTRATFVLSVSVEGDVNRTILREVGDDSTVFLEAEYEPDAREYYELGADYVILSAHLASEHLADYVEMYLVEPDEFAQRVQADATRLRERSPFESVPKRGEPSHD